MVCTLLAKRRKSRGVFPAARKKIICGIAAKAGPKKPESNQKKLDRPEGPVLAKVKKTFFGRGWCAAGDNH